MPTDELLQPFVRQRNVLLKTRKRDGAWVATPVNIVVDGDHAYFRTWSTSGKAKRLRNFADVEFAPSTARGRRTGPALHARARLLAGDGDRHARDLMRRKYPLLQGVWIPLAHFVGRYHTQHYALSDLYPASRTRTARAAITRSHARRGTPSRAARH